MQKKNKKPKEINYKKKFEELKKRTDKDLKYLRECWDKAIEEKNKYFDQLQEKSKGRTITIKSQIHTLGNKEQARERVRKLLDAEVWYFDVDEKK